MSDREYECIFFADAQEIRGKEDSSGSWTKRNRYDISKAGIVPFVPSAQMGFCGLFPETVTDVCLDEVGPSQWRDDWHGAQAVCVSWDCRRRLFLILLGITVHLPWESSLESIKRLLDGWDVVFNERRSKGHERRHLETSQLELS